LSPLRGVSPASVERGAGAELNPLSSRHKVPMNFATLNKKWFHEVNISVTIPSPTQDARARTHARTHALHDTTRRRTRRIGQTCIYVYLGAYVRAIRTHIDGRIYTRSFSHACSFSPSNPLSFSRAGPLFGVHHGGHACTREGSHTRVCKRAAHARVKNERSERGIGRTARREGERKRALCADREGRTEKKREREKERQRKRTYHARGRALAGIRHAYMHAARARIPQDCRKNCTGEAQQRANRTARESSALASRVPNHSTTR